MLGGRSRKLIENSKSIIKKKSKKQDRITTKQSKEDKKDRKKKKHSDEDKKKKKKEIKNFFRAYDGTMDTLSRITQKPPRYNFLEEENRNGENKTPVIARCLQCFTLTSYEL